MDFNAIINRCIRAAKLDVSFYKEAKEDSSLQQEALQVVLIVAVVTALANLIGNLFLGGFGLAIRSLIATGIGAIVGYYVWAYVAHFVGTSFFGGKGDVNGLLRTLGYAYAPQILGITNIIPCIGWIGAIAGGIWSLVCGYHALREGLELDSNNAIITIVVSWIIVVIVTFVIAMIFGVGSAMSSMIG